MADHVLSFAVNAQVGLPDGRTVPQTFNVNLEFPLPDGRTLVQGPLTYNVDGLATKHNADFIRDPRFAEAYRRGLSVPHPYGPNLHVEWRVYLACWVASNALRVRGDFVECGVATGIFSRAICSYLSFEKQTERTFWLLDTFEGYPAEQATERERASGLTERLAHYYTDSYDAVRESFAGYANVRLVKGKVPGTLSDVEASRIAYLSLDMNAAAPELAALEAFWEKLAPGAFVLMDDYGWTDCIEQKRALDEFARGKDTPILGLPTGQGLLIRP